MQTPIPVGPDPSLPSPVGPLSGFAGLSGGGGGTVIGAITTADLNFSNNAVFNSIFGAIALAAGKWVLNATLYITSAAAASGGVQIEVVAATSTGIQGTVAPSTGPSAVGTQWNALNTPANSVAIANYDASASPFSQATVTASLTVAPAGTADLQIKNSTNGQQYTVKAGSIITLTKVG